jgi:hypothetical protein
MIWKCAIGWIVFTLFVGLTCVWASVPPEKHATCEVLVHGNMEKALDVMFAGDYKEVVLVREGEYCVN